VQEGDHCTQAAFIWEAERHWCWSFNVGVSNIYLLLLVHTVLPHI